MLEKVVKLQQTDIDRHRQTQTDIVQLLIDRPYSSNLGLVFEWKIKGHFSLRKTPTRNLSVFGI